jgi:integrase/recombinase XerD
VGTALRLVRAHDDRLHQPPAVDLLTQWQAYMTAYGCSPSTVGIRFRSIQGLLAHAGLQDPLELTRDDVIAWLGRPIKPWTRLTYWKSVRAFSRWLVDFGHDPGSDLTGSIPKPRTPEPVARPIDDATIERLLALQLPPRPHAYVRLALYQALRVHEIAKIRGEDFDFGSGWLLVEGKGGLIQPIPIHPEVRKLADRMPEIGYWFPSSVSPLLPVRPEAVSQTITGALKRAGSTATAHQLRDTAATRFQRQTKDIRLTQSMLRHRSVTSTQKYTEASNAELQKAVNALDWTDAAQQEPRQPNALPDLATLTPEQLQQLTAQLAAMQAQA